MNRRKFLIGMSAAAMSAATGLSAEADNYQLAINRSPGTDTKAPTEMLIRAPARTGKTYGEFQDAVLRDISAALDVPYKMLTWRMS